MIATKTKASARRAEPRRWTFAEMLAELPETNQPTELWDGELVKSPSPSFFHQEIVVRFHDLLRAWVGKHGLGQTGVAPLDMILSNHRVVQPDVFFVSNERLAILTDRLRGAPDLVVEVLSPETRWLGTPRPHPRLRPRLAGLPSRHGRAQGTLWVRPLGSRALERLRAPQLDPDLAPHARSAPPLCPLWPSHRSRRSGAPSTSA